MIVRVWEGLVPGEKANAYGDYLAGFGIEDYKRVPGNLGVTLLRQDVGAVSRFLLLSCWTSRAALEAYAGSEYQKAHYYAFDLECLLDPPVTVQHYQVVASWMASIEPQ